MKILYSCLSQSWGGMEMFTLSAVQKLLERNFEVELLCYTNSKIYEEALNQNIKIHTSHAKNYFHPFQIIKLSQLINKQKFNIIHTQASKDLWLIVPSLKILWTNVPLIFTKQVGSYIIKKDMFHRFLYKRITYALAISSVIKNNLLETTPLAEDKIKLLHNGVDMKKFNPAYYDSSIIRKEFRIKNNELIIGMLARFSWGKGHEEFLYAAKILKSKYENLKFMIVGQASRGENEYADKIKKLTKDYHLENDVIFTGFRKDIPQVLAAMDIFAFPSHSEAFGIALVEAMAMGKPNVCSNSDGVLDIVINGTTGLLFQKQDGKDLADKLEILINTPGKRKEFSFAARKRAVNNFDLEVLTDKVIEIYKEAINLNRNIS